MLTQQTETQCCATQDPGVLPGYNPRRPWTCGQRLPSLTCASHGRFRPRVLQSSRGQHWSSLLLAQAAVWAMEVHCWGWM